MSASGLKPDVQRTLRGGIERASGAAVFLLGLVLASATLYAAGIGTISEFVLRGSVIWLSGILVVLKLPLKDDKSIGRIFGVTAPFVDLAIGIGYSVSLAWFLKLSDELWSGLYILSDLDLFMAAVGIITLIELTRRAIGLPLAMLAVMSLAYALLGDHLPWIFRHAGFSSAAVAQTVWYGLDGVFGLAAAVMVNLVFVYIVFGALLESTSAGDIMLRVVTRATEGLRGGAAHGAIAASGLFGMISGSATANVVGTGVFTMGLMKRRGFAPAFAGGVEASASAGGQFLPPVMGAAAFLMSELVGVPYLTICLAALLPALFYFGALFTGVALTARREGMDTTPGEQRTRLTARDLVLSLLFVIPIVVIIYCLVIGRSPAFSGFAAICSTVGAGLLLNPELRRKPQELLKGLAAGGIQGARMTVAVGAIGILIGVFNMTGLGTRVAETILSVGSGDLFISLVLTSVASIVLGMGLPTLPAYLLVVIVVGPVLAHLGVPLLAAHLFVMYFGVFSALTPPVALAAFAAAPLVGETPTKIGLAALKLSLVGFIIPFVFVYDPALLIIFAHGPQEVVWVCIRLAIATWLVSTAVTLQDSRRVSIVEAGFRLVAGLLCLTTPLPVQCLGIAVGAALLVAHRLRGKAV